jgi:hypothetical protein
MYPNTSYILFVSLQKINKNIMLTTIKGTYDHGKIILNEEPPVVTKAEVIITFLTDEGQNKNVEQKKRIIGGLEGKVNLPDDFNEPLDDMNEYMK